MFKLSIDDLILKLNKEVKLIDKEIDDLISNSELNSNKEFVLEADCYSYCNLMGKRTFLSEFVSSLEDYFTPEGEFYKLDKRDYNEFLPYYLEGEYEALDKLVSLLLTIRDVPCNTSHENLYKK